MYKRQHKISSYIKLQDHEKRKTRAYTEEIGKYYNMKTQIFEDELYYICHDGRELHHILSLIHISSEAKSPPSKFILICLLLSSDKVFTILMKCFFVCIINGFEHLKFTTNGCSFFIHLISEKQYSIKIQ